MQNDKILLVGLGNFPKEYDNTRHNIGFLFIDFILNILNINVIFEKKFKGSIANTLYNNYNIYLLKPNTYMNLSGESVALVKNKLNIPDNRIIVIQDDIDIPLGKIKVSIGNANGGHNGIKSIDQYIKKEYLKFRIGVGRPNDNNIEISHFVLSKFTNEELTLLEKIFENIYKNFDKFLSFDKKNLLNILSIVNND